MEAIGQLAGGIAHDFNNILASIIGYTELAMIAPPHADRTQVKTYLSEVVSAGQRARDLISQMLTFTRAHRGNAVATDIRVAIGEVSRMLRAAIPKTIDIRSDFAEVPEVRIDPVQFQQVLINLLVNARDAITGNGRIDIRLDNSRAEGACVACGVELHGDFVELTVADTGHGIELALLPRVFDMFVSTREAGRGTGMGLWLVNTIVHEYGGHLKVDTSTRGTTFHVYLPAGMTQPEASAAVEITVAPAAVDGHIVVVDDEVSVANFIGEVLRNAGFDAIVFNDAAAAIDHMTRHAADVSLVLTDFAMPQLSGLDVAEAIGGLDVPIPVVIVTGYADRADKARMARLGVARLLTKPFRIEALLSVVRELAVPRRVLGAARDQ
ncbi:MAG: response regulator [Gammaproteobacteria bacterium]|nr:response regulator [Gammaproteobacteria bacterium]